MKKSSNRQKLVKLTTTAVLSALSIVLMYTIRFPIFPPPANFYEMEFADVPILICSWLFGPLYALASLLVVCVIQSLTVSVSSQIIGCFMHFLSSGLLIIIVSLFKKKIEKYKGIKSFLLRVGSVICGVLGVILVMIPMNIWQASIFMRMPPKAFIDDFLWACIAFNAIKAGGNVILYSVISPQLVKIYKKLFNM